MSKEDILTIELSTEYTTMTVDLPESQAMAFVIQGKTLGMRPQIIKRTAAPTSTITRIVRWLCGKGELPKREPA